jgi:hypothetical protein
MPWFRSFMAALLNQQHAQISVSGPEDAERIRPDTEGRTWAAYRRLETGVECGGGGRQPRLQGNKVEWRPRN